VAEQDEVVKIKVGKFAVGIVGLQAALEEVAGASLSSDDEVAQYLLEQLKSKNYIPPKAESEYAKAFLREYRKHMGEPIEVEKPQGLEVKVLGPGCPNCEKLEQMVYQVMETENIIGSVEHVRDLEEIASYGLVGLPALVINGEVKSVGRFPRESQLRDWLEQAAVHGH
jgi:small redox-active disulfide protein 2